MQEEPTISSSNEAVTPIHAGIVVEAVVHQPAIEGVVRRTRIFCEIVGRGVSGIRGARFRLLLILGILRLCLSQAPEPEGPWIHPRGGGQVVFD